MEKDLAQPGELSESERERREFLVARATAGDETAAKTPRTQAEKRIAGMVARAQAAPGPAAAAGAAGPVDPRPAFNMVSVGALAAAMLQPATSEDRDRDRRHAAALELERKEDRELAARARRIDRRKRAAERWVEKGLEWRARSGAEHAPPDVAYSTYRMMQEIQASAERCRHWLRRWARKPKFAPILADIKVAALEPLRSGGYRYDLSDGIARRTIAIALGKLAEAMSTLHPKERWQFFVRGISISRLCGLLHAPGNPDRKPHRNSIGGAGRKSDEARAAAAAARWPNHVRKTKPRERWRTPLMRLRDAGFLFAWQPPRSAAAVCELATVTDKRGGQRVHVRNRYLLAPKFVLGDAAVRHVAGENWAREKIRTPLRYDHDGEAAPP